MNIMNIAKMKKFRVTAAAKCTKGLTWKSICMRNAASLRFPATMLILGVSTQITETEWRCTTTTKDLESNMWR